MDCRRALSRSALGLVVVLAATLAVGSVALAQETAEFRNGFRVLADLLPDVVGEPIENEHPSPDGDLLQQTTTGLMVLRKIDNRVAFTDGFATWISGPYGVQLRSNDTRFDWEIASSPVPAPLGGDNRLVTVAWGTELLPEGHRIFYVVVTNNHPYVTVVDVELTAVLASRDGSSFTEQPVLPLERTSLKPGEQAQWELNTTRQFSSSDLAAAYVRYYANQTRWGLEYYASWRWEGHPERVRSLRYRVPSLN